MVIHSKNPKVSIIVPVYNVEKYIHRCIDSILSQTFADFECILVNDCSPDNCPEICDNYTTIDTRIKVIHKIQNQGSSLARKTGFENSSGDYIQFIDSDDWIERDMTEKLYTAALESDADITVCDFYKDNEDNYTYEIQVIDTEILFNNLGFEHCCAVWNKFYRRKIISLIEFPKEGKYEDRVITQQALYYSKKICKIQYPLYHYCNNPSSISHNVNILSFLEWRDNITYVINFLRNNLNERYSQKEKNINDYVNNFKLKVKKNKFHQKEKSLLKFYPESKFIKWYFIHLIKKTIIFFIPKKGRKK